MGIAKLEEIVLHDEPEGCHELSNRDISKVVPAEVAADAGEGLASGDVGVHRDSISGEQFCMGGQGSEF